jgi:hypothetical protein
LDTAFIIKELTPLAELKEEPAILARLRTVMAQFGCSAE